MATLKEDLTALKAEEEKITRNKVSRFAYTAQAYTNNDADGVEEYNFDNEQNIPVGTAEVMKVNNTVIDKGYRAQASSITRMLMNHFLGRISYNLNKINDHFESLLNLIDTKLGEADGIATLDTSGLVPNEQLPIKMSLEDDVLTITLEVEETTE